MCNSALTALLQVTAFIFLMCNPHLHIAFHRLVFDGKSMQRFLFNCFILFTLAVYKLPFFKSKNFSKVTNINEIGICNNAPLGVVLAAISIKSKLILNNEAKFLYPASLWEHKK